MRNNCSQEEFNYSLHELTTANWIYKFDEFYLLQDNFALISRRRKGNTRARQMIKTAEKLAGFLSAFPFVRGVAVSGSLSKNFADENSDIDFFIITAPNRLWLARSFMHAFKKLTFLFKKQDWFCMNYYIDEEMLNIREKNVFTATEVATLLPLRGINTFRLFFDKNKWSREFLPNHVLKISYVEESKNNFFKRSVEFIFNNPLGNLLDKGLMKITRSRWQKKSRNKKLNRRGIVMGMDAGKHYAKPDPEHFQKKIMEVYEKNLYHLFQNYENKVKTTY
jgi:predicted nucleotidyltransferase